MMNDISMSSHYSRISVHLLLSRAVARILLIYYFHAMEIFFLYPLSSAPPNSEKIFRIHLRRTM